VDESSINVNLTLRSAFFSSPVIFEDVSSVCPRFLAFVQTVFHLNGLALGSLIHS
jgi:hypothetical protein